MSRKQKRAGNALQNQKGDNSSLRMILNYTLFMAAAALVVLVPLAMKDGYTEIDAVKFEVYKYTFCIGYGLCLLLALLVKLQESNSKDKINGIQTELKISSFDFTILFSFAYMGVCLLSSVLSPYDTYCFWGVTGWYMGTFSQLSFVVILLLHRYYDKYNHIILYIMMVVSFAVILFGVLHRFDIDPLNTYRIGTEQEMETGFRMRFLSTIGQASWYSSYVMPMTAIGCGLYIFAEKKLLRVLMGIYCLFSFMTLITQNSDSAYVAFAGILSVYFLFCLETKELRKRFLYLLCCFVIATRIVSLLYVGKEILLEYDTISSFLLFHPMMWLLSAIVVLLAILYPIFADKMTIKKEIIRIIRWIYLAMVFLFIAVCVLILVLDAKGLLSQSVTEITSKIHYLHWSQYWGSGRGRTWEFSWNMFRDQNFGYKLFGVGPDMFAFEGYTNYREVLETLWPEDIVVCAHNEFLNSLINLGILGTIAYAGIFGSVIYYAVKMGRSEITLMAEEGVSSKKKYEIKINGLNIIILAAALAYLLNNFFGYQQVCSTPFIFLIMGFQGNMSKRAET